MSDNKTAHASSEYDSGIDKTIPYYRAFHAETLRVVEARHPSPRAWLDTGCGNGTLVREASARFPDTEFFLSDPSAEMLGLAVAKNEGAKVQAIGSWPSEAIPAEYDGRFDVVTAIQAHHYLDRDARAAAARRCRDLLKPGGVYITFENTRPLTADGEALFKEYWRRFQVDAGKTEEAAKRHMDRYGVEYFPITVPEHIECLHAAGFSAVELLWYSYMQSGYLCIK
jgi:tRNA (cmo5U34)-methyltransferase